MKTHSSIILMEGLTNYGVNNEVSNLPLEALLKSKEKLFWVKSKQLIVNYDSIVVKSY